MFNCPLKDVTFSREDLLLETAPLGVLVHRFCPQAFLPERIENRDQRDQKGGPEELSGPFLFGLKMPFAETIYPGEKREISLQIALLFPGGYRGLLFPLETLSPRGIQLSPKFLSGKEEKDISFTVANKGEEKFSWERGDILATLEAGNLNTGALVRDVVFWEV